MKIKTAFLSLVLALTGALHADEQVKYDEKTEIEALKLAVANLTTKTDGLTSKTSVLDKVKIEGLVDLRFDDSRQTYKRTGSEGVYGRRAEAKIFGKLSPAVTYSLGFDFVEAKMKDFGVEIADVQLIPFTNLTPGWTYQLKLGQYRQPFGIVPQTSSSATNLAERPMIFGGATLLNPGGVTGTNTKIVGERVMGAFVSHKKKLVDNVLSWEVQGAVANSNEDQAVGKNKLGATDAFPAQILDESPTLQARVGLGLDLISTKVGMSYIADSRNLGWNTADPTRQRTSEIIGYECQTAIANNMLILQGEYVHAQNLSSTGSALAPVGKNTSQDGYYVDVLFDVLPIFTAPEKGDALQLIFRVERYWEQDKTATVGPAYGYLNLSGLAGGIKWSYLGGKNHTAVNYYIQANDGMYGGYTAPQYGTAPDIGMPSSLLVVQQQVAF